MTSTPVIDLERIAEEYGNARKALARRITICAGTGCVANGALKVFDAFVEKIAAAGLPVVTELKSEAPAATAKPDGTLMSHSGCQGFCQMGPLVTLEPEGILYTRVQLADVDEIVNETLINGRIVDRLLYEDPSNGKRCKGTADIPFYVRQARTVLRECGHVDPENIAEYIHHGGYFAARRAWTAMQPKDICEEITLSGLRGRGGGGFPTGRKWEAARVQPGDKKYVICNGDEGDPGAFMDRSVMEGNPHSVLEGLMIAARAIGADEMYVYVRAEYPLAVKRIRRAVQDAEQLGLLGDNVFGTGQSLRCHVMEGAGAFVCGEETALIASIEGQRGMPRPKPPFPAQSGLWGKPTIINNVETLATVPLIIRQGAAEFRKIGTEKSPGTKTFALTGHVANTGLIEVPFGTTLREIVFNIGGGVTNAKGQVDGDGFRAVQIGGPSGGCLTQEHLDLPLDFDSLTGAGAMVGSGGLVVMNKSTCMVNVARFFMQFTQNESCGKCVLCREGTKQMLALLDDIIEGRATGETLELLERLAVAVKKGSLCGLGKTAPNPVLSTLRYFRAEYEAHVHQKSCPARQCKGLLGLTIDPEKCKGCGLCARKCPVNAISGEKKQPHRIDSSKCLKCGACEEACKFKAISWN
ncbi:MAG TPA: NADH-ubiquinone oxidoreductase-F iron-sulfur binding region domain-containing protein [Phycisphaerae bacterium]|jgi:NADH-quinone oxidoreductase subunit F|nr:4Fe-4S binding protein [Phycisphaerae bacterium]HOB74616.1 NADH-ubiquinone oxidoreductase-F iron-sulfur binding region domain-containing protein [Phycisphaerae bacterium]HOJ53571.1 NADH-ubiquinone oxidoreductase-F iron-sulfur binding region domain-containing protein [Phycisphaerae bacterium]HOL25272.1 NADH-ubiquinone oxidoreductase-F iron-sulfur binding region domain-containing protein [Phycisphaerae bacterium]HPP20513.1 NADH-ubiquinone oxidoreductase-F iron-sulfur binding region domain-cont